MKMFVALAIAVLLVPEQTCLGQRVLREWQGTNQANPNDYYGWAMAGVGDVDADGIPDVAVGAQATQIGAMTWAGRLYVYSGLDGRTLFTVDGSGQGSELGAAIVPVGDLDRDGHADMLTNDRVAGMLLVSGRTGTVVRSWPIAFGVPGLAGVAGDVDGDTWTDLLMVTVDRSQSPPNSGVVELLSGRTGALIHRWTGTYPNEFFGAFSGPAGDFDGDGTPDVVMAGPGSTALWQPPTGFWVFSGRTGATLLHVPAQSVSFPRRLLGLGDVDGDGLDDIGATDLGTQHSLPRVQVYGVSSQAPIATWSMPPVPHWVGDNLSRLGDLDGDGHEDVITGGRGTGGHVTVFSGRDQSMLLHVTGGTQQNASNCAGVGDVDGDGFPDFLAGSFYDFTAQVLTVRLYSGAPDGVTTIGIGCPDATGRVPRIGCTYVPSRGQAFRINLSRTHPGRAAVLALGLSETNWNGVPLPLDLTAYGLPFCLLLTSVDATVFTVTAGPASNGRAFVPMTIPSDPALAGATFHAQWLALEPPGGVSTGSVTAALRIAIQ